MCISDEIIEKRNRNSKIMFYSFLPAFLISLFTLIYPVIIYNKNILDFVSTISLLSLGLGMLSVSLVIFSWKMGYESDTKMIQNVNVNFLQALSDFEKARINYNRNIYNLEAYIWRSRTHIERANELDIKLVKCKHHHRLIQYFTVTLEVLFNRNNWGNLTDGQQDNLKEMYKIARQYKIRHARQETNFLNALEGMGKRSDETEEGFYHRLFPED